MISRWEVDVKRGSITEGRWGTIKSQLNHFVAYCGIVGRSERSSVTRLSDLESKSLQGYQQYRQQKSAKDVTIRNEQATINALCKWAFDEGLHSVQHYVFPGLLLKTVIRSSAYNAVSFIASSSSIGYFQSLEVHGSSPQPVNQLDCR